MEELTRIVGQIREHWPNTRIVIRGDSGFCRDAIMSWCEDNDVFYVLGLARNSRLVRAIGEALQEAKLAQEKRVKRHAGSVTSATGPASLGHANVGWLVRLSILRRDRIPVLW